MRFAPRRKYSGRWWLRREVAKRSRQGRKSRVPQGTVRCLRVIGGTAQSGDPGNRSQRPRPTVGRNPIRPRERTHGDETQLVPAPNEVAANLYRARRTTAQNVSGESSAHAHAATPQTSGTSPPTSRGLGVPLQSCDTRPAARPVIRPGRRGLRDLADWIRSAPGGAVSGGASG